MDIVFCETQYHYNDRGEECCRDGLHSRSYEDFWALVRISGFEIQPLADIDLFRPVIYIICPPNGELRPVVANAREAVRGNQLAKVVAWDLEVNHRSGEDTHRRRGTLFPYVDEVWVSDQGYQEALRYQKQGAEWEKLDHIDRKLRYVPMGSDERLVGDAELGHPKVYDFIHLSYIHGRRNEILRPILNNGRYNAAPNSWGLDRHIRLMTTKVMLNVHQWPVDSFEVLRFALAAAYKLPVLSEPIQHPGPLVTDTHYIEATTEELQSTLNLVLQDTAWCERMGESLHQRMCHEYPFADQVNRAASELSCLAS
jgi:hypothetical protein